MKNKYISFEQSVARFAHSQELKLKREKREKLVTAQLKRKAEMDREVMLKSRLVDALTNIRKLIISDVGFRRYLIQLFGSRRAIKFDDRSGVCGFPAPQLKVALDQMPEFTPQTIIRPSEKSVNLHYSEVPSISVLVLYKEYESTKKQVICERMADGESWDHSCPVIALTTQCEQFLSPNSTEIANCQLVIVDESTDNLCVTKYAAVSAISLDPGFVTALNNLSAPRTTVNLFLNRFGLIKE